MSRLTSSTTVELGPVLNIQHIVAQSMSINFEFINEYMMLILIRDYNCREHWSLFLSITQFMYWPSIFILLIQNGYKQFQMKQN